MKTQPLISRRNVLGSIAVIASFALLSIARPVAAQLPASSTPLVINRPGVYVLNRDIQVASGDAITITASGVTLDLNGRMVSTNASGAGRGIVIQNANGITVKNGKIGSFNMNIMTDTCTNLKFECVQIVGSNLPIVSGPSEIGFAMINTRAAEVTRCTVSSVSLGLIIRGSASGGNNIHDNTFVGGADTSRNLLGVCWNPLAGAPSTAPGPKGDRVYNNHISQFLTGLSFSAGSDFNVARDNTIVFINNAFSPTTPGDNVVENNTTIQMTP